ncbi:MAG: META domain-containing protein, partial [Gammaproteobacteria bacterium]
SYRGTGHQSDSSGIWRFLADGTELLLAAGDREGQCLFEIDAGSGLRWLNKGMESASLLKRVDAFQAIQPRTTQATDGLENVHWRLTELEDVPVVGKPPQPGELPQPAPWLTLNSLEHSVIGQSGCNLMTGHYLIDDSRLEFVKIATTRRACMPGITIEQGFLAVLERVKGWRLDGLKLDMLDANGQPVAHFRKEAPKPSMPRPSRRKTN